MKFVSKSLAFNGQNIFDKVEMEKEVRPKGS